MITLLLVRVRWMTNTVCDPGEQMALFWVIFGSELVVFGPQNTPFWALVPQVA